MEILAYTKTLRTFDWIVAGLLVLLISLAVVDYAYFYEQKKTAERNAEYYEVIRQEARERTNIYRRSIIEWCKLNNLDTMKVLYDKGTPIR